MTIWFTSDHHFGHDGIVQFCGRPFASADAMDQTMIDRWNAVVGADDEVWHLGNFAYRCGPNRIAEAFRSLRGRALHLVRGNHDRQRTLALPWASVQDQAELVVDGRLLVLSHYSFRVWHRSNFGSWNLHGHSHGRLPPASNACDVGVDVWNFAPASFEDIRKRMQTAINPAAD